MNRHNILFLPHNRKITVEHGENLIRAAMEAGVHINAVEKASAGSAVLLSKMEMLTAA